MVRTLRVLNGAFLGFCLAVVLIALGLTPSQRQEPNAAVLMPLLGGLVLGGPIGGILIGRLPEWPTGFPGKEVRTWLWWALGALIGVGIGFGCAGGHAGAQIFLAYCGGLVGLELAALLQRASSLIRTLVLMIMLSAALWVGNWAWGRH